MKHLWKMVLEEPYRVFFPLGICAGIWGVMLWPALYAGWIFFYPNEAHMRLMIEGFLGAFAVGFLGTAFPRLTGNRAWFAGEFFALLTLWFLVVVSHAMNHIKAGDAAFCAMLACLILGMAGRWVAGHKDTPPPGFVLAFAGLLGAGVAAGFLAWGRSLTLGQIQFARLWLFQGFLLMPLMGIGPYVLPRLFGMPSSHSFDDSPTPPPGWWKKAGMSFFAGLLIVTSFLLEAMGYAMAGQLLRATVVGMWFALETPLLRKARLSTTPGNAARWALLGLTAGCVCAAFWPYARVGSLHLFFISGLGLITLTVGTRVVLGHAGRHDLLGGKIVWLRWVIGLLVLAALTRMTSDFIQAVRFSHHIYAAWTWALVSAIWLVKMGRYLSQSEDEKTTKSNCPRRKR